MTIQALKNRKPLALLSVLWAALVVCGGSTVSALDVKIKGPLGVAAGKIDFGVLSSSVVYHTAPQYLEITHPDLPFRKIYLYSDNNAVFGVTQEGLVSTNSVASFPLHFRNYTSTPAPVQFTAADAPNWAPLMDRSAPGFDANKELARLSPGSGNLSWVYLGLEITPGSTGRGGFGSRLVVEDWSDYGDVAGPTIALPIIRDLILLRDVPVGFSATLKDQNTVVDYALHYRLRDDDPTFQVTSGERPALIAAEAGGDGFSWVADAALDPNFSLRVGGILEYYFTAVDTFTNITTSIPYYTNLIAETGFASLGYSANAGSVGVAIGDPRWPGLEIQFPVGSLRPFSGDRIMTVGLKAPSTVRPNGNIAPARVFQLGPEDLSFLRPVTVLLPYNDGKDTWTGTKETDLRLFWFDGFDWHHVGRTVDTVGNRVRASVTHLGVYGLFPTGGSLTAERVRPKERILTFNYPNDLLRFNTTVADGSFDIEIFDIRGATVRKIHNSEVWDGRDESGRRVESGTYVYRFQGQGITLTGMIAVAR